NLRALTAAAYQLGDPFQKAFRHGLLFAAKDCDRSVIGCLNLVSFDVDLKLTIGFERWYIKVRLSERLHTGEACRNGV
ncbi:hypothetical protein, partial [Pseudomonas syringae group genomosp. 7]|uniref:hypothetical protein n=1 Tax=Pseudomonas syringae group genomosp. 7 TaxID=251699 RepID=UPI00376F8838